MSTSQPMTEDEEEKAKRFLRKNGWIEMGDVWINSVVTFRGNKNEIRCTMMEATMYMSGFMNGTIYERSKKN